MDKVKSFVNFILALAIAAGFIAVIWLVTDSLGAWDVYKAQQETRAAEAHARQLEAEAQALRERQAMVQTWVTSFASAKDSVLVTLTYLGGGLALFLAVIVICVLLLERGRDGQAHTRFDGR